MIQNKEILNVPFSLIKANPHYGVDPSNTVVTKLDDEESAIGSKDYLVLHPGKIDEYRIQILNLQNCQDL